MVAFLATLRRLERENNELRARASHTTSPVASSLAGPSAAQACFHGSQRTLGEQAGIYRPARNPDGTYVDVLRDAKDFPEARFWNREDWREEPTQQNTIVPGYTVQGRRGSTRMAQGENVRFKYITHANGTPVSGHRIKEIGDHMRDFFVQLKDEGIAPSRWHTDASASIKQACYKWMRSQCFELQLCENNWKTDAVAVAMYPPWKQKHLRALKANLPPTSARAEDASSHKGKARAAVTAPATGSAFESESLLDLATHTITAEASIDRPPCLVTYGPAGVTVPSPTFKRVDVEGTDFTSTPDAAGHHHKRPRLSIDTDISHPVLAVNESDDDLYGAEPLTIPPAPPVKPATQEVDAVSPLLNLVNVAVSAAAHATSEARDDLSRSSQGDHDGVKASTTSGESQFAFPDPLMHFWSTQPMTAEPTTVVPAIQAPLKENVHVKGQTNLKTGKTWPPLPTAKKPKDICARFWAAKNPTKDKADYDNFYKGLSATARKVSAQSGDLLQSTPLKGSHQALLAQAHMLEEMAKPVDAVESSTAPPPPA
ncbi:hypothetical protein BN946_scf184983.g38 [Trametes cinnabarina]|uniref:Uncharacterized protein n=1 Tax=Pycnoporus cinnabarinus TaxID=5643 RepID=A0A060SDV5_PYCCI|nr:hypothetical protein BN946_scf184983.g38 [Trametes cinnabarina]